MKQVPIWVKTGWLWTERSGKILYNDFDTERP